MVHLRLRKPKDFSYRPGQYLFLNCPQIATFEWHPFTITTSPLEDTLEVHIRNLGNWTGALHELVGKSISNQVRLSTVPNADSLSPLNRRIRQ
ncbi:MAG: hypothetical protein JSR69_09090 [Proteobacteria bacterium]|nr:hypothetical protein [Pseudomonadota bacterium]